MAYGASRSEITRARNTLLKTWHPDHNPDNQSEAKEKTLEILLASDVLLNEKTRTEYDAIFRYHFGVPPKPKPQPKPGDGKQRAWKSTKPVDIIVCPGCGRRNINPKSNACMYCEAPLDGARDGTVKCPSCGKPNRVAGRCYCMFCGAGIGPNPRPFVMDDNLSYIFSQILNTDTKPRLSEALELRILQIIFIALVFFLLKILVVDLGSGNRDIQSISLTALILSVTIILLLFFFFWHKKNGKS